MWGVLDVPLLGFSCVVETGNASRQASVRQDKVYARTTDVPTIIARGNWLESMAIGIDPTVDYAFKLILGSPEHPAITLHFLNAVSANFCHS